LLEDAKEQRLDDVVLNVGVRLGSAAKLYDVSQNIVKEAGSLLFFSHIFVSKAI
jgi:hypothetical protein